jgi:acyl carrier protein
MDQISQRLEACFARVFPKLSPEEIRQANVERVAAWDSMASITLLSLIDEEFGVELNMDDFEQFTSFPKILGYIRTQASDA